MPAKTCRVIRFPDSDEPVEPSSARSWLRSGPQAGHAEATSAACWSCGRGRTALSSGGGRCPCNIGISGRQSDGLAVALGEGTGERSRAVIMLKLTARDGMMRALHVSDSAYLRF